MKTMKTIVVASTIVLVTVLGAIAQDQLTPAQTFVADLRKTKTFDEVAALEVRYAKEYKNWSETDRANALYALQQRYAAATGANSASSMDVVDRYASPSELASARYAEQSALFREIKPAWYQTSKGLATAKTVAEFDAIVNAYFTTNLYPKSISETGKDSRIYALRGLLQRAAETAVRVGAPDAINWALAYYRYGKLGASPQHEQILNNGVSFVASALKAKDISLARANAFIDSQNTGEPKVTFTQEELATPAPILNSPQTTLAVCTNPEEALQDALSEYRIATTSAAIDEAIYGIASVLRAHDLNLVRANAFITAQKEGQPFDLTLDTK